MKLPVRPAHLYHWTCSHGADAIYADGLRLRPNEYADPSLVWLTSLAHPDRKALGLTSRTLACDRMEWRCIVDPGDGDWPIPYVQWARLVKAPRDWRDTIESFGCQPLTWWVSEVPLQARDLHEQR